MTLRDSIWEWMYLLVLALTKQRRGKRGMGIPACRSTRGTAGRLPMVHHGPRQRPGATSGIRWHRRTCSLFLCHGKAQWIIIPSVFRICPENDALIQFFGGSSSAIASERRGRISARHCFQTGQMWPPSISRKMCRMPAAARLSTSCLFGLKRKSVRPQAW